MDENNKKCYLVLKLSLKEQGELEKTLQKTGIKSKKLDNEKIALSINNEVCEELSNILDKYKTPIILISNPGQFNNFEEVKMYYHFNEDYNKLKAYRSSRNN